MKNIFPMNSKIYTRLSIVATIALLAACSAATPDDKKEKLAKLKEQQTEIAKQVLQLEEEIAKENPSDAKVKMKDVAVTTVTPGKFATF